MNAVAASREEHGANVAPASHGGRRAATTSDSGRAILQGDVEEERRDRGAHQEVRMGTVIVEMWMSLDGFVADLSHRVGPLFDWCR
jgi:hypothetical protein